MLKRKDERAGVAERRPIRPRPQRASDGKQPMGHIYVDVTVRHVARRQRKRFRCLVDTGATDTQLPRDAIEELRIKPHRTRTYELGDGTIVNYEVGHAVLGFEGEEVAADVIFGPAGTEPILGVTALESTGFVVDPRMERLRKVRAIPQKAIRSERHGPQTTVPRGAGRRNAGSR